MDQNEEYHDPDYQGVSVVVKEEVPELSEDEKIEKIKRIIRREFSNELEIRENEVMLIEQRMSTSRRLLQRLRYVLVSNYFQEQKLQLSASQIDDDVAAQHEPRARAEVSTILREGQRRLHPSVRKLLGKKTADLAEIFKTRAPRNKARKDYSAMVQSRNYTIPADATKSLRPEKKQEEEEPSTSSATVKPKKVPRQMDPRGGQVLTLEEATRNKMKHRYRLIIGNTSKYAPPASRADRSTHKWLLYIRGPPAHPDPSPVLTHVVATLHHSYAPHHTVHVYKPPFHITRRGWGEFPARVELHFPLPDVNRPVAVEHTIKLDRNYTGLQTLGSETVIEVWLYSTPEMLPFEYVDPVPDTLGPPGSEPPESEEPPSNHIEAPHTPVKMEIEPQTEVKEEVFEHTDSWMEFFSKDTTELDVDEMIIKPVKKEVEEKTDIASELISKEEEVNIKSEYNEEVNDATEQPVTKRIMKYIDSTTGKIYYLEMDRTLDLSKVQEIVINNTKVKISPVKSNGLKSYRKKKGVSLLKPEVQNQLKSENCKVEKATNNFTHIENDHCYLGNNWFNGENATEKNNSDCLENSTVKVKKEKSHFDTVCSAISSFSCVKVCVNYLLKNIPIITDRARDPDYVRHFPFVVENGDRYWRLDFAKRRNIEWSRAKLINKILTEHFSRTEPIWRTKQILIYSRLHGHHPMRLETTQKLPETDEWSSWNDLENSRALESNIKEIYPNAADISSLTIFNGEKFQTSLSETLELTDSDEEVDIVSGDVSVKVKKEVLPDTETSLTVLPVENEDDRLRFMFIEKNCADIGIELRNEDVGNGYSYSAVHAVLLSAVKSFADELIRSAMAAKLTRRRVSDELPSVWTGWSRNSSVQASDIFLGARGGRLSALTADALGAHAPDTHDAL
ncbi:hypothetical protein ABMA27_010846 [Loxostege sticticalis]|uniref:YEATS domain-containing protein n=1 Tax=Loxostege sticticalis TaxID=481309 RepID=A0ABR3H2H4_LOXSC